MLWGILLKILQQADIWFCSSVMAAIGHGHLQIESCCGLGDIVEVRELAEPLFDFQLLGEGLLGLKLRVQTLGFKVCIFADVTHK